MPNYPNRCQHIKVNGTQCASPALRRNRLCYFHKRNHEERIQLNADREKNARARRRSIAIDLPVFEDANSIQVSLMQMTRLLISGDIDTRTAGLVLYALQIASGNLGRTRFEPRMHEVILDPARVGEIALRAEAWADSDFAGTEDDRQQDDGFDRVRHAGILKTAEFLYDLDHKKKPAPSAAPKPAPAPAARPDVKATDVKVKKGPTPEISAARVREQLRQQVVNAAPALLAANPGLIHQLKHGESRHRVPLRK